MADCACTGTLPLGSVVPSAVASGAARLDPSRAPFAKTDADFDPTPYLGVFAAACYVEPELLRKSRLPPELSAQTLVASGPQRGRQADLVAYLAKWDERGRLLLEPPWTTRRDQQGTLFVVPKSSEVDRVVFNRILRNANEFHLPGYARFSIGGHNLTELIVEHGSEIKIFTDDLSDAFPAFRASRAHGVSNALSRVRPCFLGLPMGDLNAADFCAEAHTRVLRRAGSFPRERAFVNSAPVPRGGAIEALVIDDRMGIAVEPPGETACEDVLHESFSRAAAGYATANRRTSAGKARRAHRGGVVLGAEFVAESAFLGTERVRRRRLAEASILLASGAGPRGTSSGGCWDRGCMRSCTGGRP